MFAKYSVQACEGAYSLQARAESREGPEAERRADVHEVEDRHAAPETGDAVDRASGPEPREPPQAQHRPQVDEVEQAKARTQARHTVNR